MMTCLRVVISTRVIRDVTTGLLERSKDKTLSEHSHKTDLEARSSSSRKRSNVENGA